jgi:Zn-dependent peptidase ImmA (M78 family)
MYAFDESLGGCILIDAGDPPDRCRASLMHEYGHLIVDRFKPGIDYLECKRRKAPNEKSAEAFAMAFLMPARDVRERFCGVVDRSGDFRVADLCFLAKHYFVSVDAMARRLEDLGLVPRGTIAQLKGQRGLKVREAEQALGAGPDLGTEEKLPRRYRLLAVRAFRAEKLSEGQLTRFLRCTRVEAREVVVREEAAPSWKDPEGPPQVLRVDIAKSLLK